MKTEVNAAGGTSVILGQRDNLDAVPESHRDMITNEICLAFANPEPYFRAVADRCQFPMMAAWLRAVTATGKWNLYLEEGFMMERTTRASFFWRADNATSAFVAPTMNARPLHPLPAFAHYFSIVDVVDWACFGGAGHLLGAQGHFPISAYGIKCQNPMFPQDKTLEWGNTPCGDVLIYTNAGKAGFLSHENGKAYSFGSIEQGIDFVFGELLEGREPEFDYSKVR